MPFYPWNVVNQGGHPNSLSLVFFTFGLVVESIKEFGWCAPKSLVEPTWVSNYVELRKVGTWGRSWLLALKGGKGVAKSPGIRLRRGTRLSSLNLHPKTNHIRLVSIWEHLWVLGQAKGTLTHNTHHGPDSGEATTFPHIVYFAALRWGYI
jgi:hypothetical protein